MKFALMMLTLAAIHVANAHSVVRLEALPSSPFADTEAVTNVPCASWCTGTRWFEVGLILNATPSNCVEIAFGCDANEDGKLGLEETAFAVGWDCGHWVARGCLGAEAETSGRASDLAALSWAPVTAAEQKAFMWQQTLRKQKDRGVEAWENNTPIFTNYKQHGESWFYDPTWNMVRITVRGVDAASERIRVKLRAMGMSVIIR